MSRPKNALVGATYATLLMAAITAVVFVGWVTIDALLTVLRGWVG